MDLLKKLGDASDLQTLVQESISAGGDMMKALDDLLDLLCEWALLLNSEAE